MARPKIPRKSTTVDMTAMCDVAFLLLSFFILTTKPKPSEAVHVDPPSSVSAKKAPEKDIVMLSLDKDGKVFISTGDSKDDRDKKEDIIRSINTNKALGLTDAEIAALKKAPFIGVPLAQLKVLAKMDPSQINSSNLTGIPCQDTAHNEMVDWIRAVKDAYAGQHTPNILMKGDNIAKYPVFKNVVAALKKNDLLKFQMVTNPEGVPEGSLLYKGLRDGSIKATDQ
jgi:biopolymer transport protein ExbD